MRFFRFLRSNKWFSIFNIIGLAVCIASSSILLYFVWESFSYDNYHTKKERIVRIANDVQFGNRPVYKTTLTPIPLGKKGKDLLPEVEEYLTMVQPYGGTVLLQNKDIYFREHAFIYSSNTLFDVFSFEFVAGNSETALNDPFSLIVTQSAANKYFGNENPIGQIIRMSDTDDYIVTAVIKDIPENTHLEADFFASLSSLNNTGYEPESWKGTSAFTYFLLNSEGSKRKFDERLNNTINAHLPEESPRIYTYHQQDLKDIYLHSHLNNEWKANASYQNLLILLGIGLIMIVLGAINYANLATAQASKRYTEIGVRKYLGASKMQIFKQFIQESAFLGLISGIVGLALIGFLWPYINKILDTSIFVSILELEIWITVLSISLFTGLLAGVYPAILMSGKNIVETFKGEKSGISTGFNFRKISTVTQFSLSAILVICTVVMMLQFKFINNKDLGFEKEGKVSIPLYGDNQVINRYPVLKQELERLSLVSSVTASSGTPGRDLRTNPVQVDITLDENDDWHDIRSLAADIEFIDTYKISLLAGRNFVKEIDEGKNVYLVNKAFVDYFGWENVDQALENNVNWRGFLKGPIVGVVDDFHYMGVRNTIEPTVIAYHPRWFDYVTVSLNNSSNPSESLAEIKEVWNKVTEGKPFDYYFVNNDYFRQYEADKIVRSLVSSFSFLAVIMACFGIVSFLLFYTNRKLKEIAIRKVLGAELFEIGKILSKELFIMILISLLLIVPIGYIISWNWLSTFVYRITLDWMLFIVTLSGLLGIVLFVTALQTFRSFNINPIKILKNE